MTDRVLSMPVHGAVTCTQLPGREIGLARREMMNASGGLMLPTGPSFMILYVSKIIAEAIVEYFDDEE